MLQHKPEFISLPYHFAAASFFCSNTAGCLPSLDDGTEQCLTSHILQRDEKDKRGRGGLLKTGANKRQCRVSHQML